MSTVKATAARRYIFREMRRIKGFLDPCDALIYQALIEYQNAAGDVGGAAEIGIFYGRSYFLLRLLTPDNAPIVAIDPFEIGAEGEQLQTLMDRGERLGLPVDRDLVFDKPSQQVTPQDILNKAGPIRFFSIDGGHQAHHVSHDAALAEAALAPHGVIVFDDFFNPEWPEVSAAAFDFLRSRRDALAPFAISEKKLYVAPREAAGDYRDALREASSLAAFRRALVGMLDDEVLTVRHPIERRIAFELLSAMRLGFLTSAIYPRRS